MEKEEFLLGLVLFSAQCLTTGLLMSPSQSLPSHSSLPSHVTGLSDLYRSEKHSPLEPAWLWPTFP